MGDNSNSIIIMMVSTTTMKATESLVVLNGLLATIKSLVHMIRILDGVGLIVIKNHGGDGRPSLC